jgi:hypothetical protein
MEGRRDGSSRRADRTRRTKSRSSSRAVTPLESVDFHRQEVERQRSSRRQVQPKSRAGQQLSAWLPANTMALCGAEVPLFLALDKLDDLAQRVRSEGADAQARFLRRLETSLQVRAPLCRSWDLARPTLIPTLRHGRADAGERVRTDSRQRRRRGSRQRAQRRGGGSCWRQWQCGGRAAASAAASCCAAATARRPSCCGVRCTRRCSGGAE